MWEFVSETGTCPGWKLFTKDGKSLAMTVQRLTTGVLFSLNQGNGQGFYSSDIVRIPNELVAHAISMLMTAIMEK